MRDDGGRRGGGKGIGERGWGGGRDAKGRKERRGKEMWRRGKGRDWEYKEGKEGKTMFMSRRQRE